MTGTVIYGEKKCKLILSGMDMASIPNYGLMPITTFTEDLVYFAFHVITIFVCSLFLLVESAFAFIDLLIMERQNL